MSGSRPDGLRAEVRTVGRGLATRPGVLAAAIAVAAGVTVVLVARGVFPYHSVNHDEGVYLRQAAMLLDGRLAVRPPVPAAFRPWFFVEAGEQLYPKYSPVPATAFAAGMALGWPRFVLGIVGAAVVAGVYGVTRECFYADDPATLSGRRTALLAALLAAASPQFLVETAVFLPYAPTAALNLLFAVAYLRADRLAGDHSAGHHGGSVRGHDRRVLVWAAVAGAAVGLAFFARPYTAVLFAVPFVAHAAWSLRDADGLDRRALGRLVPTAALGLAGVGLALAYNAVLTGDPLMFPYEAFAPRDGLGFGYHEIAEYGRVYAPALALEANARVVWTLLTRWTVAGPLGAALAAVGLGRVLANGHTADPRRAIIAGLVLTVVGGNVYFWGNLNLLGAVAVPGDGLIRFLGPYYHYDLLLPLSAFGAWGALLVAGAVRHRLPTLLGRRTGLSGATASRVTMAVLVAGTAAFGATAAGAAAAPLEDNREVSDRLAVAYEPFEGRELDDAVVFLPTPYGDWLGHPFQALRNNPGYDTGPVYALRGHEFAVVDAYPDRRLFRYTYRGRWSPSLGKSVDPRLERVHHVGGDQVALAATLGIPSGAEQVGVRVAGAGGAVYAGVADPAETLLLNLSMTADGVTLSGPGLEATGAVETPERGHLLVQVHVGFGHGQSFTYRLRVPLATGDGAVRALTPYVEVCRLPRQCGGAAAYVPGSHRDGVRVRTQLRSVDE